MKVEHVGHLDRGRPIRRTTADFVRRAGDNHDLIDAGNGCVPVAETDVDRSVRADDRIGALILITGIGIGLAAESRARG